VVEAALRIGTARGVLAAASPPPDHVRSAAALVDLAEACADARLPLEMGAGFLLCAFSDAQLGVLLRLGVAARFGPKCELEVGPGARARAVGGEVGGWVALPRAGPIGDVVAASAREHDWTAFGLPECARCRYRGYGTCGGGEPSL
jgi:hypothetical protein